MSKTLLHHQETHSAVILQNSDKRMGLLNVKRHEVINYYHQQICNLNLKKKNIVVHILMSHLTVQIQVLKLL